VPVRVLVTASRGMAGAEYLEALREAGAEPVRVDPSTPDAGLAFADAAGLLVTGGVDVDPAAYEAPASPYVTDAEPERDMLEIELLQEARKRGMPTFCICRGLQIANVAFGGTLIDDVPSRLRERATIRHRVELPTGKTDRNLIEEHVVRIAPDSLLASVVGTESLRTGARHHQAVDVLAPDLREVGATDDGIVEALEARFASPFWLAVQWHPESTRALDGGASRALFAAFVAACERGVTSPSRAAPRAR